LVLASGHIAAEEALLLFREARSAGVQHMIATHAMDLSGKMTMEQMQQAAKLGVFIEFDMRNTLEGGRTDAIRKLGPQVCFLTEFWTPRAGNTSEYGSLEGIGAFAEAMHARGFSDEELDLLFKVNPARILGLPAR
jgi:predicted metal-dependent phosphotriesterase family hydrolase